MAKNATIYTKRELITPEIAAQYLQLNKHNRPLSLAKVKEWAKEMKEKKWRETHQGIAFDTDGNLIDGQHRLSAVVESGESVYMIVAYNCDPESFRVIDDGMNRSGAALFSIQYKIRFGDAPSDATHVASVAFGMLQGLTGNVVPKEDSADHAMKHLKLISEFMPTGKGPSGSTNVCAAFCNASLYFGRAKIQPLVDRFTTQMWTGVNDPLKILRDRLLRAKLNVRREDRLSKQEKYGFAVAAIRACLTGKSRQRLEGSTIDFGDFEDDKKIRRNSPVDGDEKGKAES